MTTNNSNQWTLIFFLYVDLKQWFLYDRKIFTSTTVLKFTSFIWFCSIVETYLYLNHTNLWKISEDIPFPVQLMTKSCEDIQRLLWIKACFVCFCYCLSNTTMCDMINIMWCIQMANSLKCEMLFFSGKVLLNKCVINEASKDKNINELICVLDIYRLSTVKFEDLYKP